VAFAPDGRSALTGNYDGTAILWDVSELTALLPDLVNRACAAAGSGLSQERWAELAPGIDYRETCP